MDPAEAEAIAFLTARAGGSEACNLVSTHISRVIIGPEVVFKLKRPVRLAYLDFSTAARRLAFCEREYALNRRSDPDGRIYRGVRRISRGADGALGFDGDGDLVDAVVEMNPFDNDRLLDRLAGAGPLQPGLIERLAHAVADLHAVADVSDDPAGAARMERVLDINAAAFVESGLMDEAAAGRFDTLFRTALARHSALLDTRAIAGKVRRGHGDLHLRNICLIGEDPVLFDCLEFDEDLATTDVLYDLAFLVMDLWHRGQRAAANLLVNRHADRTGEREGLALLPFLVAVRAAVRAHVLAATARDPETPGRSAIRDEAQDYVRLAEAALAEATPRLAAVGGLSGSGKSTLAAVLAPELAPLPGARTLNTDRLRKALFQAGPETRLGPEAYRPEVSATVYGRLREEVAVLLAAGVPVIADAVHARPDERAAIAAVARKAGVPFLGVWLDLSAEALKARVTARRGGPSDATAETVDHQLGYDLGEITWTRLDSGRDKAELVAGLRPLL
ncbi:AAA family ATPase [Phreatobacter sp.]|uniref:bifunctional aminoglycoside phosphotransferase/ATP-binding protein n=1 Tax=Phreatobacter sp. TaxID=1966341 RepID=UPI003F6F2176